MLKHGWMFHTKPESRTKRHSAMCGAKTWFGYKNGNKVGYVWKTFRENGTATLKFGNCRPKKGVVIVYLNDIEISRATSSTLEVEAKFKYFRGDVLSIMEEYGIIKLNSLKLNYQGMMTMYYMIWRKRSSQKTLTIITGIINYSFLSFPLPPLIPVPPVPAPRPIPIPSKATCDYHYGNY